MEIDGSGKPPDSASKSAHTTGRRSTRMQRIEVITRGERRRVWTTEQKRDIVAESLDSGTTPTEVRRKYGITSGQLYIWRRQMLAGGLDEAPRAVPSFARVEVVAAPRQLEAPQLGASNPEPPAPAQQRNVA